MTSFIRGLFADLGDAEWRRRQLPGVVRKAALKTLVITALFTLLIAGLAVADPIGSSTGGAADVVAKTAGSPTLGEVAQDLGHLKVGTNLFFLMVGVALIFFMQAGFAMVETGFCRAKNATHVVMTNFIIFATGGLAFWAVGFALAFGGFGALGTFGGNAALGGVFEIAKGWGLFGTKGFFLGGDTYDVAIIGFFLFQLVFMDTAGTIVTGAMAERWKFSAFVIFGFFIAAFTYPIYANWVWGGGWLAKLGTNLGLGHGVLDFAGSSVVHMVGGFAALAGAMVLGPRLGKFKKDGTPNAIPGHHIPMAIFGTIILVFGWMGFNGMSTLAATDLRFTVIIANTVLAACAGGMTGLLTIWKITGKPDASMSANGMLAGLVAITAPCAFVSPLGAVVIGAIGGVLVVGSVFFIERVMKVDDPVGASSVHGVNGAWGMIALGLFADGTYGDGFNGVSGAVRGLFYGGGFSQLYAQLIAVAVAGVWAFGTMYVFFKVQDAVMGIRSSEEDELVGLDATEMGLLAYPDFEGSRTFGGDGFGGHEAPEPKGKAKPVGSPVGGEA